MSTASPTSSTSAASGIVSVRALRLPLDRHPRNTIGAWLLPMLEYVWKKDKVNA
jgi:hypothetical protein